MGFSSRRFRRSLSTLNHMLTKACCEPLESTGNFGADDPVVKVTPTGGNQTFPVKLGFDDNANGVLDAAEVSRTAPDDDSSLPDFVDVTPSATNKVYDFDNSALLPATPATVVGDYIREEKHFSYYLEIQAGSTWVEMANMKTAQELAVRRIAATGAVPTDFAGHTNYHNVGFIDCLISESEVRALVGGSDPIDITSGANA